MATARSNFIMRDCRTKITNVGRELGNKKSLREIQRNETALFIQPSGKSDYMEQILVPDINISSYPYMLKISTIVARLYYKRVVSMSSLSIPPCCT